MPPKAAGITLAETLIYLSILSVVVGGIWQTITFINSSINTNISRTAELEQSETYLNYISTLSGRAVSSDTNGDGSCVSFVNESPSGEATTTKFKLVLPDNAPSDYLRATGWVSNNPSSSCDDNPAEPIWRALSDKGALSLSPSSLHSLDLNAIFKADTAAVTGFDYEFDTLISQKLYKGARAALGTDSFEGPSGAGSFTVDFWLQNPFGTDFTAGPPLNSVPMEDNTTILAFGDPVDKAKQVVIGFEDRKLVLRRGSGSRKHSTAKPYGEFTSATIKDVNLFWNHIAIVWNGADNSSAFYFNGLNIDNTTTTIDSGPNGWLHYDLPITSHLYLGSYDRFDISTTTQRSQARIDELRIWRDALNATQIKNIRRRESLVDEPGLIGYWRFEQNADPVALSDNTTDLKDWTANSNHLRYFTTTDNVTYTQATLPIIHSKSRAPIAATPFKKAGSNDALSLEMQFVVTNAFGEQKRQSTLSKRVPVARFAPVGLVALEDNSSVEVQIEIIGSHDDITLEFDALFDPSVKPQANACDLYDTVDPNNCNFTASAFRIQLDQPCQVADNETLATCTINSNDITLQEGIAFSSIELRNFGQDSGDYQTVPGDKITMQIYETCTFGMNDDGTTAMLIDTGYMQGDNFINQRSYVTYSFEAATASENIEYLFGTPRSGDYDEPQLWSGKRDVVRGSPDLGAFTKRRHISPFLFRTTNDNYSFVMGFDKPYRQWDDGDDLWNNHFTPRYQFTVTDTDDDNECSSIGLSEIAMCAAIEDNSTVKVCNDGPTSNVYCFVEFQISNMPTNADAFVKLDETNEYQKPQSTLEDFVGVNRWGGGATDGFVVNLEAQDLRNYADTLGDPLMQVKLRAGMDYWYLMTTPDNASAGKTVKLRTGETDTVRYRLSTSKVCP